MTRFLPFLLLLLSFFASAAPIVISFDKIPLMQFSEATFKAILKEDYIIDPSLIDDSRRITINVSSLTTDEVRPLIERVLSGAGIRVEKRKGINWLLPAGQAPVTVPGQAVSSVPGQMSTPGQSPVLELDNLHLYRPLYRPVAQLQRIVNSMLQTSYDDPDFVFIAADDRKRKQVLSLLAQYDVKPLEIYARAAVIEYSQEADKGFSFKTAFSALAGKLSVSVGSGSALDNFISFKNSSFEAVLSAIEGDSHFSLVTQPTLRIRNGATGRFTVGSDVPVLDSVQVDKQGNPVQSVVYRQSGVIFSLKPSILADRIDLEVSQQLSNFQKTQTSSINSPTLLKRELATSVGVKSGELIVLAGLEEAKDSDSTSGFSFLPGILKTTKTSTAKTQLLLVLEVKKVD